jgi:TRAP-type transport system periplasmic protein
MGVTSFQALQAPMLVDSYSLEQAVIASSIPDQMLQGLDKVGVHGLGVLADGLRKPAAVKHPLLEAADWRGITFGIVKSEGQAQAIQALGANPKEVQRRSRKEALSAGEIRGLRRLFSTTAATGWRKLHRMRRRMSTCGRKWMSCSAIRSGSPSCPISSEAG